MSFLCVMNLDIFVTLDPIQNFRALEPHSGRKASVREEEERKQAGVELCLAQVKLG